MLDKRRAFSLGIVVLVILAAGAFLRFYKIQTRPGFEWDEPVYWAIAAHTADYGFPAIRPQDDQPSLPYLFQPLSISISRDFGSPSPARAGSGRHAF